MAKGNLPAAWRAALLAGAVLLAVAVAAAPSSGQEAHFVDYLYVEAGEGGSSGGHAAIALGDRTFHYQHDGGRLRATREGTSHFLRTYALLENRPIHASRVAVSADTFERLREAFNRRLLVQSHQSDALEALRADRELIELLWRRAPGDALAAEAGRASAGGGRDGLWVAAAGLFAARRSAAGALPEPAPALVALRARVVREHGASFLEDRAAELRRELVAIDPEQRPLDVAGLVEDALPVLPEAFSARYGDRFAGLLAVEVLCEARPLRAEAHHAPADDALRVREEERAGLEALVARLEDDAVSLVASRRPGWSFALLVGMARLVAARQSLESGRLVLLDAFPDGAGRVAATEVERQRSILAALRADAEAELETARTALRAPQGPSQAQWSAIEAAGSRLLELGRAADFGGELRVAPGALVASRGALREDLVQPALGRAELERALAVARENERRFAARLRELYGYDLVARNCVSELFRVIDSAFADAEAGPRELGVEAPQRGEQGGEAGGELDAHRGATGVDPAQEVERSRRESRRRLGGHVAMRGTLRFVPFVSSAAVREAWSVRQTWVVPSHRSIALQRMAEREGWLPVRLRESSTVTSTIYGGASRDSTFLFFTDDAPALRPILGALNLATGAGAALLGMPLAPLDGGQALLAGLRGVLFSVPELAFVGLRKGTFDYVPAVDPSLAHERAP